MFLKLNNHIELEKLFFIIFLTKNNTLLLLLFRFEAKIMHIFYENKLKLYNIEEKIFSNFYENKFNALKDFFISF